MVESAVPSTGDPAIEAKGLGHTYKGGHTALDGVDLSLGTGLFGLLGPNGAGKSTLMRIICTLLVPTAGTAKVYGYDVTRERREVRELIGYLPQEFGAWRHHRTEEVLDTLARLSGLSNRKERRRRVAETLEMVGLDGVADRKVKKLSGGMVRRLGVAQALVHEPQVLIVDEPTVGLDPEERMRFRQLMNQLGRDRTILLSTHIVADLGGGCREMALLDSGRVEFQGTPENLLQRAVGRVFEVSADAAAAERIEGDYEIVSRAVSGTEITLRGVSANGMPDGANPVDAPTLEEAYLAFMAARGRSEAARQDDESPVEASTGGEGTA
ncbi:MAG: ATP-binding cassette domain-containing protein [Gammaproteobacteria bacterium]|nr:ATP-binding cassette domain-containing protein [Gammaproteobacteria bacterium]MYF29372.1 ATP-binding cassette domain-containing protein [Gammaproteobacteria bacterium]MYK48629.1 ATP-binding cassette domain-containing protein [Gammaproteobacteria bacterium]